MRAATAIALWSFALLLMAAPAVAAPPSPKQVGTEGRTTTTIHAVASIESDDPVTFHLEYGTTAAYGRRTTEASATFLGSSGGVDHYRARQTITGLSSGTQYHVRVVATNASSTVPGPDTLLATEQGDVDGDGQPDDIDPCPNAPGPGGCPQADADGDGRQDSADLCPTLHGIGNPRMPGCPPFGTPAIRTGPVQITPQGVMFKASGSSMGRGGFVSFQISLFEDFKLRGSVEQSSTHCWQRTGVTNADGKDQHQSEFRLHAGNPGEAWWRDAEVTCLSDPDAPNAVKSVLASGRKLYVRAVLRYPGDDNQIREIAGNTQTYGAPGGGTGVRSLGNALEPRGKAAKIGRILKKGGYSAKFTCPGAGKATVAWTAKVKRKTVTVAKGAARCSETGGRSLKIALTRKGKALLGRARRVKLKTKTSFTPRGGKKASVNGTITLKR